MVQWRTVVGGVLHSKAGCMVDVLHPAILITESSLSLCGELLGACQVCVGCGQVFGLSAILRPSYIEMRCAHTWGSKAAHTWGSKAACLGKH